MTDFEKRAAKAYVEITERLMQDTGITREEAGRQFLIFFEDFAKELTKPI